MRSVRIAAAGLAILVLIAGAGLGWRTWQQRQADARQGAAIALTATAEQFRSDELNRIVRVGVRNHSPFPVRVTRLELVAPPFAGVGPVDVDVPLPVGGHRRDIPTPYGTATCTDEQAPAHANLWLETEDGLTHTVRLELPHPNPLLNRLLTADCNSQLLATVGTIRFGQWTELPDGRALATLLITRAQRPDPLTVHDVRGSVLYEITTDPPDRTRPIAILATGANTLEIPLIIDAHRCTGHAIGDASKPFLFPIWLAVGDGDTLYSTITIAPEDERALRDLTERRCQNN